MDHDRRREHALWAEGIQRVAGVDEAGVGPLAGPVVAAAVILPRSFDGTDIDDSKKLSETKRLRGFERVSAQAISLCIAEVWPHEIDELNIYHATLCAMTRALGGLHAPAEHVLVDGRQLPAWPRGQTRIVGGDAQELSIAAASILAKVWRDAILVDLDAMYPGYGFAGHKGYPTQAHRDALARLGPTPVHRFSYPAVQRLVGPAGTPSAESPGLAEREGGGGLDWKRELARRGAPYPPIATR